MGVLIGPLYFGIHQLNVFVWDELKGDDIYFLNSVGSEVINACIFDFGFCFPMLSIVVLRVFYPFEYKSVLEFISVEDKIDNLALGRWFFKRFSIAGVLFFIYGLSNITLLKKDSVYYKDSASLPHTIFYKNVMQIVDYEYFGSNQDSTVSEPLHNFWITTKDGQRIVVSGHETLHKWLQIVSGRSGAPFVHIRGSKD